MKEESVKVGLKLNIQKTKIMASGLIPSGEIDGKTDWFQIGKGIHQVVYSHPACLTYMQSTSCEMPGWMKYKLESRLAGEISIISDTQMTLPVWQKAKKN